MMPPKSMLSAALLGALLTAVAGWGLGLGQAADPTSAPKATIIDAAKFADLQAAFDAVPAAGGLVKLPPGDFVLTKPLVLSRENTRVEGSGAATHLINKNEEGQPAVIVRPENREKDKKAKLWRVQLADLRISGNPKSGDGLLAEAVNEIYLHGISVDHHGGHGVNLVECYEDPRVSDSIFTYNAKAGVNLVGNHDIVVNANHFEENFDALRCLDGFNLCMNGNNIDDHLGNGVIIENTYGSVVSGNMIEECKGWGVILDRDCYGITVSANVIAHNFGGGADLRDAWGCSISANTFVLDDIASLKIGPKSGRITVTGNNFSNSHIGDATRRLGEQDVSKGVLLDRTTDIVLTGNVFSGLGNQAVRAEGPCTRIVLVGNAMTDLAASSAEKLPAFNLGEATGTVVENNAIDEGK